MKPKAIQIKNPINVAEGMKSFYSDDKYKIELKEPFVYLTHIETKKTKITTFYNIVFIEND